MKTRKTVLLSAIAVLLCVYIVQLISAGRSSVKTHSLKAVPDVYTIKTAEGTVTLTKTKDAWIVGDKNWPASENLSSSIADMVKDVKVLDTVSHSDTEAMLERYGLDSTNAFTVTASSSDGKVLRTITVGKESSTGSQTYIKVDSAKDIYLASGSYKNTCRKTAEELRSLDVYRVNADDITHIDCTLPSGSWSLDKSGKPAEWSVSAGNKTAAPAKEKLADYAASIQTLSVQSWAAEDTALPDSGANTVNITAGQKKITVTVYQTGTGDDAKFICTSSETPYRFYISKYVAERYMKTLEDISK